MVLIDHEDVAKITMSKVNPIRYTLDIKADTNGQAKKIFDLFNEFSNGPISMLDKTVSSQE